MPAICAQTTRLHWPGLWRATRTPCNPEGQILRRAARSMLRPFVRLTQSVVAADALKKGLQNHWGARSRVQYRHPGCPCDGIDAAHPRHRHRTRAGAPRGWRMANRHLLQTARPSASRMHFVCGRNTALPPMMPRLERNQAPASARPAQQAARDRLAGVASLRPCGADQARREVHHPKD